MAFDRHRITGAVRPKKLRLRAAAHLWAGGPAPWEYLELTLCRDVYHCTPMELERIPAGTVMKHLSILGIEAEVQRMKSKHK